MHEIICPHCGKAFKIDEAGYADSAEIHGEDQIRTKPAQPLPFRSAGGVLDP
jgi:hypothetical protein